VKRARGARVLHARSQQFQIKQIPSSLFAMGKRKARKEAVRFAEYQPAESANAVSLFMNGCLTGIIGREEGRRSCPVESGSSGSERCYYLLLARSDRRAGEIIFISAEPVSVCVPRVRSANPASWKNHLTLWYPARDHSVAFQLQSRMTSVISVNCDFASRWPIQAGLCVRLSAFSSNTIATNSKKRGRINP